MKQKIEFLFKKKAFWLLIVPIILVVVFLFKNQQKPNFDLHEVSRRDLFQELSFTGKIKPSEAVDLSFERSGRIILLNAEVGEKVSAGEVLASLDASGILADVEKAEAGLLSEKVRLEELKKGPRPEEIKISQAKVDAARIGVEEAKRSLIDKINDAYTKSDDAVRNKIDKFFSDPRSQTPRLNLFPVDSQIKSDVESMRVVVENLLKLWISENYSLSASGESNYENYLSNSKNYLTKIKDFLDKISIAVNSMTVSASFSQTTIDSYKADVSLARTNINAAISALSAAEEKLRTSEASLALAGKELNLVVSGTSPEQIKSQEARVMQAEAVLLSVRSELSKTSLRTPINGVVSRRDISVGEIASANQIAFSVISDSKLEIEANIPEIDIAKINLGSKATITLDAYGQNEIFEALVAKIEPAETVIEGVSTYKTKLVFSEHNEKIKPGMTANIEISIQLAKDVLAIPQRAVLNSATGEKTVNVFKSGKASSVKIQTGAKSFDGFIEVVGGLSEKELVVLP